MAMHRLLLIFALTVSPLVYAQAPASFKNIGFLLGTWEARTSDRGTSGATSVGTYTFQSDLNGTVVTRTSSADSCKGPATFDCQHHDLLTIYRDSGSPGLHALYADSEGHVLHYDINSPDAKTAIFETSAPGPKFRLMYHFEGGVMAGKFQIEPPGAPEFKSYLEWSGTKK